MLVYVAGKITSDPGYKLKFARAAAALQAKGYEAINPAVLPDEIDYDAAMRICLAMLQECDAICLLDDWRQSKGACIEFGMAQGTGKKIMALTYEPTISHMSERAAQEWARDLEEAP